MGTRINVVCDHQLPSVQPDDVAARLALVLPAALGVEEYWRTHDPLLNGIRRHDWVYERDYWDEPQLICFDGPGSLFVTVSPHLVHVGTGGRWRGLLTIPRLREVHLNAFRAIAMAFGASQMALHPDTGSDIDWHWMDHPFPACVSAYEAEWGMPQNNVDAIDPQVSLEAEHTVPLVWYLESVERGRADVQL